jgi:hypothetical protein
MFAVWCTHNLERAKKPPLHYINISGINKNNRNKRLPYLPFQDNEEFKANGNDNASDTGSDYCEHSLNCKLFSQSELNDLIRETNSIHENQLSAIS